MERESNLKQISYSSHFIPGNIKKCEIICVIIFLIIYKRLSLSIFYAGADHVFSNLLVSFHWTYKKQLLCYYQNSACYVQDNGISLPKHNT